MDKPTLEKLFDALRRLREGKELSFVITRVANQVSIANGPVSSSLIDDDIDQNMINWIIQIVGPIISSIASGDENSINTSLDMAVSVINQQTQLNIPKEWLRSEIEPLVSEELKLAHLHRSSSFGNILMGFGANKLYRENRITHEKYPFVQLRFDFVDNNAPQPISQSFTLETYKREIASIRDALNQVLDILDEDGEQ